MKLFLRELSENIMNKLYLKYVFFVFLSVSNVACSESDSHVVDAVPVLTTVVNDSANVPDISYTVENEYSKIDSDDSPVGYWEVDLSYPVLPNPSNASEIIRINQAIKDLVNKYTCAADEKLKPLKIGARLYSVLPQKVQNKIYTPLRRILIARSIESQYV